MNYRLFFWFLLGWVFSAFMGYKFGDSRGYADGFEIGYRYDCKDEIGLINDQVQAQSKALVYTDSALKRILKEKEKERKFCKMKLMKEKEKGTNKLCEIK